MAVMCRGDSYIGALNTALEHEGSAEHKLDLARCCPNLFQQYAKPSYMADNWDWPKVEAFAAVCLAKINDGTIFTEAGRVWFINEAKAAMAGCGKYCAPHLYRALVHVLDRAVPGDGYFHMGTGTDEAAFSFLVCRGVSGLKAFNAMMVENLGNAYTPIADTGRLSYYRCMIGDKRYMQERAALAKTMEAVAEGQCEGEPVEPCEGELVEQEGGVAEGDEVADEAADAPPAKRPRLGFESSKEAIWAAYCHLLDVVREHGISLPEDVENP